MKGLIMYLLIILYVVIENKLIDVYKNTKNLIDSMYINLFSNSWNEKIYENKFFYYYIYMPLFLVFRILFFIPLLLFSILKDSFQQALYDAGLSNINYDR